MRRPIIISLSVGAALLLVGLGLLLAQAPAATASSGSVTHTTYADFGNSGPSCVAGSNPALASTHISSVGGGAVALAGALDDDFPGSSLNGSLWETGIWGANPYTLTISNSILTLPATTTTDIRGGWVRSLTSYTATTGSPIVMEAVAEFGNGNSQHIGFAQDGDFDNRHFIFSTWNNDGNLYARVDASIGPQDVPLGAVPNGFHHYRIEWSQTEPLTDTISFYIDGTLKTQIGVTPNTEAQNFALYFSNEGSAALQVDAVDVAPAYVTSGTYTSCILDAGADNAWQTIGWDATSPAGTTLTVTARTSFDALTWSNWATIAVSGTALSPKYRYAQYELQLATTDDLTTTLVNSVNLAFDTGVRTLALSDGGTTQAAIGNSIPYTLTMTVPQTSTTGLIVTDTLPSGLVYNGDAAVTGISPAPTFTVNGNNLTWNFGAGEAVFASSLATITFSARVDNVVGNQQGGVLTNTGNMTYGNVGSTPQASDSVTVTEPAVTMSKVVLTPPSPADAGGTVAYRVIMTNTAGADISPAHDVVFTDTLPSALTLNGGSVSGSGSGGASSPVSSSAGNTVTMTVATIPAGGSVTINYSAVVQDTVNPSQNIANSGTAAWTSQPGFNADERTGSGGVNDYTTQSAASFNIADPSLDKALTLTSASHTTGSNVTIGEVITYALPVTLPEGATPSLTVTDTLPAGLAYVVGSGSVDTTGFGGSAPAPSITGSGGDGEDVIFSFGAITVTGDNNTANDTFTLHLRARVLDVAGNTGNPAASLPNSASLQVDGGSVISSNTVTAAVVEPQLTVTKSVTPSQVVTNDVVTTTITVTNTGTSTAFEVLLTDPMPDNRFGSITSVITPTGFTFSSPDTPPTTTVIYSGGTLTPGQTETFSFTATVGSGYALGEIFTNTATITATTLPGPDGNERTEPPASGSHALTFGVLPDISVIKDDGQTTAVPGQELVYTLTISNVGLVAAPNVLITDTLPSNVAFVAASDGGVPGGGVVTWPVFGSLGAGLSTTRTVTVTVNNPIAAGVTQLVNTVQATHDGTNGFEPTPSDNTGTDTDTVNAAPTLAFSKSDGGATAAPGGVIAYTLNYTNTGDQAATGVKITETVPANTTFVAASSTGTWSCANGAGAGVTCTQTIGALNGGNTSGNKVFAVRVVNPLGAGVATINNSAAIADDGTNGPLASANANDSTSVTAAPDLALTKSHSGSASPGGVIAFTLTYGNQGNQAATGVVITETVPVSTTFNLAASTAGWSCVNGAPAGTVCKFTVGAVTGGGGGGSVVFAVNIPASVPGNTVISNTASIGDDGANGPDPSGNNSGSDTAVVTHTLYLPLIRKGNP